MVYVSAGNPLCLVYCGIMTCDDNRDNEDFPRREIQIWPFSRVTGFHLSHVRAKHGLSFLEITRQYSFNQGCTFLVRIHPWFNFLVNSVHGKRVDIYVKFTPWLILLCYPMMVQIYPMSRYKSLYGISENIMHETFSTWLDYIDITETNIRLALTITTYKHTNMLFSQGFRW